MINSSYPVLGQTLHESSLCSYSWILLLPPSKTYLWTYMGDMTAQQTLSSPKASSLSILYAYYPSVCFLWPEFCGNPAQGMLQKIPLFLLRAEELVVNFSSWLTWEGFEISQDPKRSSSCHTGSFRLIWKGNWFLRPTQSLDCALSKRLCVGLFSQICVWKKGRHPREIVYQCTIINKTDQ